MRRFFLPLLFALGGAALALRLGRMEQAAVDLQLLSFPDSDVAAHRLRPLILASLCFLPMLGALCYAMAGTLARYVTRQFLTLFGICFGALLVIWLMADLNDNLDDLRQSGRTLEMAWKLYSARLPEILVMLLPYSLMLSLLYCLGLLSRSREVVAMIQTGRGLARLTAPFLATGILCGLLCLGLNYQWAPHSLAAEKLVLDEAHHRDRVEAQDVAFRNVEARRQWMVGTFPPDYFRGAPLKGIFVVQEHPDGSLESILSADSASWSPHTRAWTFVKPRRRLCQSQAAPIFEQGMPDPLVIRDWRETPTQIIRPGLPAPQLGIPDLQGWLEAHPAGGWARRAAYLTQWHSRWAQPVNCLIVVLLATPLGVVFSRRGAGGGVAMAVFLGAGMLFVSTVCLSLGDSGHLPPALAAWLPNLVFGALAIYLFHRRLAGRPIYQALGKLLPTGS